MATREAILAIGRWMDMQEGFDRIARPVVESREQLMKKLLAAPCEPIEEYELWTDNRT